MCERIKAGSLGSKYKYTNTQIHRVGESEEVIHFIPVHCFYGTYVSIYHDALMRWPQAPHLANRTKRNRVNR